MDYEFRCVVDCNNKLGECPLWSFKDQCLWWIDVADPHLWRFVPSTSEVTSWALTKPPAALALRPDGKLLILFRKGYTLVDRPMPGETLHQQYSFAMTEDRFNDGRVDSVGRMWIGSMDRQLTRPLGRLYCLCDGRLNERDTGFALSNGIAWSPDGRTMYFAETLSRHIYAYDFNPEDGSLAHRRLLTTVDVGSEGGGGPDGLCVDSAGNLWVAVFGGGRIDRYSSEGEPLSRLHFPNAHPTSCTFGGPDLDTLFVTSSTMQITGDLVASDLKPGGLWSVRLSEKGQAENFLDERHMPLRLEA